jgi:hypothetical protein
LPRATIVALNVLPTPIGGGVVSIITNVMSGLKLGSLRSSETKSNTSAGQPIDVERSAGVRHHFLLAVFTARVG